MGRDMSNIFGDFDNSEFLTEHTSDQQYANFDIDDVDGNLVGDSFENFIPTAEDEELFDSLFETNEAHHGSSDHMPAVGIMGLYVDAAGNAIDPRRPARPSITRESLSITNPGADLASSLPLPYNNGNGTNRQPLNTGHPQMPATAAHYMPVGSQQQHSQQTAYQGYPTGYGSQATGYNFSQLSRFAPLSNLQSTSNSQLDNPTS